MWASKKILEILGAALRFTLNMIWELMFEKELHVLKDNSIAIDTGKTNKTVIPCFSLISHNIQITCEGTDCTTN